MDSITSTDTPIAPANEISQPSLPTEPDSQTATDFINEQLALEASAREVLPYKFDKCTNILGPLRQNVFACLTCSPPPASAAQVYIPAGVCYACSISCHGEHHLVELFSRRNFVCDCGTTRMTNTSPCTLRSDPVSGRRGVHSQKAHEGNHYNQNFQNKFCACGEEYDAEKEKGTMFQCLGLGTVETGGCGEDWYHPECLMGLPRDSKQFAVPKKVETDEGDGATTNNGADAPTTPRSESAEHPVPKGFPNEDDFEAMICYKCVDSNPWIKKYAGAPGFLPAVYRVPVKSEEDHIAELSATETTTNTTNGSLKRKASDDDTLDTAERPSSPSKRVKEDPGAPSKTSPADVIYSETSTTLPPPSSTSSEPTQKHDNLISPIGQISLFCREDFRDQICHCPQCFPSLIPHPQLLDEEDTYEPTLSSSNPPSDAGDQHPRAGTNSQGSKGGSLYDRGEAALSNVDRVRAIEGVMAYNHLRDKVKEFLKPYAESGKVVSAEDVKDYFAKLRGDQEGDKENVESNGDMSGGDGRREQRGY
jgi:E3 ubiquitin-protein ligase UBR7